MESYRDVRLAHRARWPAAATAFIGACLLLGAAPARADNYFERGFEDQMGRILAYEAVNLGKHILVSGVLHPHPVYPHAVYPQAVYPQAVYPQAVYPSPNPVYYSPTYVNYDYDDHRHKHRGRGHRKHHDHDRGYWDRHRGHGGHGHHGHDCD